MLSAWIIFLSILLPTWIAAQSECYFNAKVVDSETGEPIIGATFRFDGMLINSATDLEGQLRMPVVCGEHSVRFTVVGYKPFARRLNITGDSLQVIEMENIATQIEEVVVTAQGAVRTIETPALGVSVLSMKAVQKIAPAAGEVDVLRGF